MDGETFGTTHILMTAAPSGLLALGIAFWQLRREGIASAVLIGLVTGRAVFLWRQSANMPQLNSDGLEGFSANDLLAPVVVFVALGCLGAFRSEEPSKPFARSCAFATVIALAVNVVTI